MRVKMNINRLTMTMNEDRKTEGNMKRKNMRVEYRLR